MHGSFFIIINLIINGDAAGEKSSIQSMQHRR
jgi:hypothetical protein